MGPESEGSRSSENIVRMMASFMELWRKILADEDQKTQKNIKNEVVFECKDFGFWDDFDNNKSIEEEKIEIAVKVIRKFLEGKKPSKNSKDEVEFSSNEIEKIKKTEDLPNFLKFIKIFEKHIIPDILLLPESSDSDYLEQIEGICFKIKKIFSTDIPSNKDELIALIVSIEEKADSLNLRDAVNDVFIGAKQNVQLKRIKENLEEIKNKLVGKKVEKVGEGTEKVLREREKKFKEIINNTADDGLTKSIEDLTKLKEKNEILSVDELIFYKNLDKKIKNVLSEWETKKSEDFISNISPENSLYTIIEDIEDLQRTLKEKEDNLLLLITFFDESHKNKKLMEFMGQNLLEMLTNFQQEKISFKDAGGAEPYLQVFKQKIKKNLEKISLNEGVSEEEKKENEKRKIEFEILIYGFFNLVDSGLISSSCINLQDLMVIKKSFLDRSSVSPGGGEKSNMKKNVEFNCAVLVGGLVADELINKNKMENDLDKVFDSDEKINTVYLANKNKMEIDPIEQCTLEVYNKYYQSKGAEKKIDSFGFIDASSMPIVQRIAYATYQEMCKEKKEKKENETACIDSVKSIYSANNKFDANGAAPLISKICEADFMVDRFGRTIKLDINSELKKFGEENAKVIMYIAKNKIARDNLKSEANFNLMLRSNVSLQYNTDVKGDDGTSSHLLAILAQKVSGKRERGQFLKLSRFINMSSLQEFEYKRRLKAKEERIEESDFVINDESRKKNLESELNNLIEQRLDCYKNKKADEKVDIEINKKIILKMKQIKDATACDVGMLAIENLEDYDKLMHSRRKNFDLPIYKSERDMSFINLSQFANQIFEALDGNDYGGAEMGYKEIMYGVINVVDNTPRSSNEKEWIDYITKKPAEGKENFFSLIYQAGMIKSFLSSPSKDENNPGKYDYVWKQMEAALAYMIIGILEKIPGEMTIRKISDNRKYKNFVRFIAKKIKEIITPSQSIIPPALVSKVEKYVEAIADINNDEVVTKILYKKSYFKEEQKIRKYNMGRLDRDLDFRRKYKSVDSWHKDDVLIKPPNGQDIAQFGSMS